MFDESLWCNQPKKSPIIKWESSTKKSWGVNQKKKQFFLQILLVDYAGVGWVPVKAGERQQFVGTRRGGRRGGEDIRGEAHQTGQMPRVFLTWAPEDQVCRRLMDVNGDAKNYDLENATWMSLRSILHIDHVCDSVCVCRENDVCNSRCSMASACPHRP